VAVCRDQTEEWKGWMQVMFVWYHYFAAKEWYNWIRVYIACYVWMTGFGKLIKSPCPARCVSTARVCPSVHPSHASIMSKWLNMSSIFFSPPRSHTILVVQYQTLWQYFNGEPPNGVVECRKSVKNRDFRPISLFISEMIQHMAIFTMERQRELVCDLSNGAM